MEYVQYTGVCVLHILVPRLEATVVQLDLTSSNTTLFADTPQELISNCIYRYGDANLLFSPPLPCSCIAVLVNALTTDGLGGSLDVWRLPASAAVRCLSDLTLGQTDKVAVF